MLAFRHNNLVYIPINKNASTSYTRFFNDVLKWERIDSYFIDWESDTLFAHIQDPLIRHLKGTVECLKKYDLLDLIDHPKFLTLLGTAVFDLHSYPICHMFAGNRDIIAKINWIPLDLKQYTGDFLTAKFLKSQGIDVDEKDIPHDNVGGDGNTKGLIKRINDLRTVNNLKSALMYFYGNDVELYNQVLILFDQLSWVVNE